MVSGNTDVGTDERLYQQIVAGNDRAYYELFERYWESLYAIGVKILKDRELAKDVVQEVFLSFWENRGQKPIQNVGGYLHRAAKFGALKALRDDKSQFHDGVEIAEEIGSHGHGTLDSEEFEQQIAQAIEQLPDRCKEVFKLSREEHLTNKEIAEKLDLSQRTVETHISNGLRILREKLPRELPALAMFIFLG